MIEESSKKKSMVSLSKVKKNLSTKVMLNRLFSQTRTDQNTELTTGFIFRVPIADEATSNYQEATNSIQRIASPFLGLHASPNQNSRISLF